MVYIIEHFSATKRNKGLIPATTWMNFENLMLNERSQPQKAALKWNIQNREVYYRDGMQTGCCWGLDVGVQGVTAWWVQDFLSDDENILELDRGGGYTAMWTYRMPLNCML